MRLTVAVIAGIVIGVILFGPIKEYWGSVLNARVATLENRVSGIEQYLTKRDNLNASESQSGPSIQPHK